MTTSIPYTVERRPDTGINNVMLGTWLFLASEVMLFGGLFSAYVLLRSGLTEWPENSLSIPRGLLITAVMIAASLAMAAATRSPNTARARRFVTLTSWLGVVFVGLKVWDWSAELEHGMLPATSTFAALYFLLTGVHAVHVIGGLGANLYVRAAAEPARLANRIAAAALYWYFIDIVWLAIFFLMYVL